MHRVAADLPMWVSPEKGFLNHFVTDEKWGEETFGEGSPHNTIDSYHALCHKLMSLSGFSLKDPSKDDCEICRRRYNAGMRRRPNRYNSARIRQRKGHESPIVQRLQA